MESKVWHIQSNQLDSATTVHAIEEVSEALRAGEVIGMPTETVYGLAADATNDAAIDKVFKAKGRPSDNPLIIHIHDTQQLDLFVTQIPDKAGALMEAFWPGPISFVLPLKHGVLSERATVGLDTVAVRMPSHPVARAILQTVDIPIAAPSANTSGTPSPTEASHVQADLTNKVFGIIESDASEVGLESTVLDCTTFPYRILRPGSITKTQIEAVLNEVIQTETNDSDTPASPGMKYKHYAPRQRVHVVENWVAIDVPPDVGVIAPESMRQYINEDVLFVRLCESETDYDEAGRNLYRVLREMDQMDVEAIYIHGFNQQDQSAALNNRIYRAAGKTIIEG